MSQPQSIIKAPASAIAPGAPIFDELVGMIAPETGDGMVAATSARVYRDTYARWATWAAAQGLSPLDIDYSTAREYLSQLTDKDGNPHSKSSKQRQLSALRKLAEVAAIADFGNPTRKAALDSLKLLKPRQIANGNGQAKKSARKKRALTPKEAEAVLHVWDSLPSRDDYPSRKAWYTLADWQRTPASIAKRNQAIVTTLLLTGVRRASLATLQWSQIDFENGTIHIEHAKGDKMGDIAIFGDLALEALKAWQMAQPSGYTFVFTRFDSRGGTHGPDAPMTATSIYRIVRKTGDYAGIGHFAPHDARRTLITEMLSTGAPVHTAQAQAMHSNGATTLGYAQAPDARTRRKAARIRYG